jgi:hypothetical protein
MIPIELKPQHEYDLIRLGQDNDGGYLVDKKSIDDSKSLITLGLGFDWTFEKNYYAFHGRPVYCYDHSVNYSSIKKRCRKLLSSYLFRVFKPRYFLQKNFFKFLYRDIFLYKNYKDFFKNSNVDHKEERIGTGNQCVKLKKILNERKADLPAFIKIDIEGSEYRIFDEILLNQDSFTGIGIELHDVDIHMDKIKKFIKELNMELAHIHPQNPAHVAENDIPTQIELTFARKPKIIGPKVKLPHTLDQPANPYLPDIELFFEKE